MFKHGGDRFDFVAYGELWEKFVELVYTLKKLKPNGMARRGLKILLPPLTRSFMNIKRGFLFLQRENTFVFAK